MPDRKIDIKGMSCLPGITGMAIDKNDALWVVSACMDTIFKIDATQLAASGDVMPALAIPFMNGEGLAFDKTGNLWVGTGADGKLVRFDAASLSSASAMPALTITPMTKAMGGSPLHPAWLAFDKDGNLWTNDFGGNIVFQFSSSALSGTGSQMYVPPALVTVGVAALLGGMAFDESGGLWITYSQGKFARLAPAQLAVSTDAGNPTIPERVITEMTLGYAENMALYPAATGTPLASAL